MKDDKPVYPFGVIPAQVFMDERLTLETMRVLGALYTFRDKHTSLAFPSRDELSSRCTAMHPSNISEATTKLVELGWLVKEGKGGNSRATRYTIRVPDVVDEMAARHRAISESRREKRVAEQATVAQSATVAEQAIPPVADEATRGYSPAGYTQRVAQQATRIEHTNGTDQLGTDQGTELPAPKKSGASQKSPCPGTEVWNAYSTAYFHRYGTEPVRNAKVNGVIKQFVDRIGANEAPHVADFYVKHNKKYYIEKTHDISVMLSDAEGLRTQWATGRTMTSARASQIDSTATNANAVNEAIEMWKRREKNAAI